MTEQKPPMDDKSKSNEKDKQQNEMLTQTKRTITLALLRKRSEHNECMVSTIEEIALHQEELESIGLTLGRTCGKTLKILLLQNNVISSLSVSEMKYFKVLRYLNLALNNITKIQGLDYCHDLEKLDLTLNFIDFDELKESLENMKRLPNLRELFIIGNPCCRAADSAKAKMHILEHDDDGVPPRDGNFDSKPSFSEQNICRMYVVSMLPHLKQLDGIEINKSERIIALQQLPQISFEMEQLSRQCRALKEDKRKNKPRAVSPPYASRENQITDHSTEARAAASQKMAEQKARKEEQERANQPRCSGNKEWEEEQKVAVQRAAEQEEQGEIRQKNEGKWAFIFDESQSGHISLDVAVPRHLSTSLIDVDIHPTFITIIIKSKILRLKLPAEVKSEESKAQRSTVTGHLVVTMPTVNPLASMTPTNILRNNANFNMSKQSVNARTVLMSQMLDEGSTSVARLRRDVKIVNQCNQCCKSTDQENVLMTELSTTRKQEAVNADGHYTTVTSSSIDFNEDSDSEPPSPF